MIFNMGLTHLGSEAYIYFTIMLESIDVVKFIWKKLVEMFVYNFILKKNFHSKVIKENPDFQGGFKINGIGYRNL